MGVDDVVLKNWGEIKMVPSCIKCGKPAVMWTSGLILHGYYCEDHIPIGFNGVVPDDLKIENEPTEGAW